jgi:tRNA(Leu) C34 or U34 (ribose-2'-O)-methylase TrmL
MANRWSPLELKALKQVHGWMLALEKEMAEGFSAGLSEASLAPIKGTLLSFAGSESLELQKLAEIAKHLQAGLSAKQFSTWIVPVERTLGRELRDDQFLIFTEDAPQGLVEKIPLVLVLDNLRSAFNVGSIFRTAECFGVKKIYLAGYTPLPEQEKLAKTAMGTEVLVPWESAGKSADILAALRGDGYRILGFETTSHAIEVQHPFSEKPTAFVFGNERFGLEAELLQHCHEVRKIPLRGQKNSLNVGVAAAIATYEFSKQYVARSQ